MPGEAAGLVIGEADAANERVQVANVALVLGETVENRAGVEVDEDPADVEDDGANQRAKPQARGRANLSTRWPAYG
jgi:hypothetical protein